MLSWDDLQHFLALASEGTLSGAARALKVDHVTVARRVAALEHATALKLVDRRARSYTLTEEGRRIATLAAPMQDAVHAVERTAQAARPGLGGKVTISAPPTLANALIAPRLVELHRQHPGIVITLIGEKRTASLGRREADLALRLSRPDEPGLVTRRIGRFGFSLYGSAAYLRETPPDAFAFIAYDTSMDEATQQKWLKTVAGSRQIVLLTSDLENQAAAVRAGLGLAALPQFFGDRDPELVRYDTGHGEMTRDIWLVVHRDLSRAPVIRAVMAFLALCVEPRALAKNPVRTAR